MWATGANYRRDGTGEPEWLYLIIAVLAVIAIGLGIYVYREESKPGIDIRIGQDGVSVEEN